MNTATGNTAADADQYKSALELHYPRIASHICEIWGKVSCPMYLKELVFDSRGDRQGFPVDVAMELFMLYQLQEYHDASDIWAQGKDY